ncbi:M23 family metallopeptidase [Glutamicibacter sp. NPDC087344]|uniref:M23 family metallopeptidase n=1 Tax=Glutamicibacter sp. NPDC087344 TaxID=3363994 RepID=UPI0037F74025
MKPLRVFALIQLLIFGIMLTAAGTPRSTAAQAPLPTTAARPGWQWPLAGEPAILIPFDKPEQKWLAGHRGVDLQASEGASVLAPQRGKVAFRSTVVDRPVLVIDHGSGFVSSLEPVSSELAVGTWIEAGDNVGAVATGAHCSKRCLHWGVRFDGKYIDPALLIRDLRPSILLPLY